ncbi:hypothetical protein O3G_MSEX005113 [Manduca sexta]|uniref:Uncharacterized protein n=1 Tax=Manduca sexta TaxID=7130 RepID=A0A921YYK6_MANSE|nr:hypothetical protein O3G_MSEX005113 [Manduca sexta]
MESPAHSNNKNVSLSLIAEYGASDSDSDDTETRSNEYTGNEDSDAPELSEMVLKNNIINACAHGPLSRPKAREVEQTTRHMIIDSSESGVVEYEVTEYRDLDTESESSSSSDSSDSEVDSVKDVEEASSSGDELEPGGKTKIKPLKVTGELGLDELPPIEDLAISLPAQECTRIGTITSIVERLVVVRALRQCGAALPAPRSRHRHGTVRGQRRQGTGEGVRCLWTRDGAVLLRAVQLAGAREGARRADRHGRLHRAQRATHQLRLPL